MQFPHLARKKHQRLTSGSGTWPTIAAKLHAKVWWLQASSRSATSSRVPQWTLPLPPQAPGLMRNYRCSVSTQAICRVSVPAAIAIRRSRRLSEGTSLLHGSSANWTSSASSVWRRQSPSPLSTTGNILYSIVPTRLRACLARRLCYSVSYSVMFTRPAYCGAL